MCTGYLLSYFVTAPDLQSWGQLGNLESMFSQVNS